MRCCVPSCKNDSRYISKSQGITFHVIPLEPNLRASWLKAIGKDTWSPRYRTTVCSKHFSPRDLYETKSGLRKVKTGAVPIHTQDTSIDCGESVSSKVCRICLAVDLNLHPIRMCKLEKAYENLTGITLSNEDDLPQKLCTECARRLLNSDQLRSRSLRANSLLQEIVKKQKIITVKSIAAINREDNKLASVLSRKVFEPDHYDSHIEYNEAQDEQEEIQEEIQDIKSEKNEEIYIIEIYSESDNDIIDENNDNDFVVTNNSSDDSLHLETHRKEVKKINTKENKIEKVKKIENEPKIDILSDDLNETWFTITDLTFEEQVAEIHRRQETSNYKYSTHKCTTCFKGFLDEIAYNEHMIRHTNQCGEYECAVCKVHFKRPRALRLHLAGHARRYSCNGCLYVTTHRDSARMHVRWHKGIKYQCPHCQDEFVKFSTYMSHIRIKHPSDFVCALCGYSFVSEKGVEQHKTLKHRLHDGVIPDDGPLCELCNIRFVSQEAYRRHWRVSARHESDSYWRESTKSRKVTRAVREKKEDSENIDDDERKKLYLSQMKKAEGPIPCEQCGLQLEDARAYHHHFRRIHPHKNRTNFSSTKSPCMCEVCGRMLQTHAKLKDHRWTHTGERPFECDACGKRFRMRQQLLMHRHVHAPRRRRYTCALCDKAFSTHGNRQRHMFIHTGLKPFKCETCGKCFTSPSLKQSHVAHVHLKKPWPKRARRKRRPDRPRQLMGQDSLPAASEMDIPQPMLTDCDPKIEDINNIIDEKPIYL